MHSISNENTGMHDISTSGFATVSLEEMKAVKLMNRIDTKFVTTESVLAKLLGLAREKYRAQEIDGRTMMPYYTLYYDTPDCEMYRHHLHGRLVRKKIRVRRYVGSDSEFLEVKCKNNKGRTDKKRIPTYELSEEARRRFILEKSDYENDLLQPRIENRFTRLTLVNRDMTERLTIDTNLKFHNMVSGINYDLSGLVVIELKRDGRARSPVSDILRELRIKPSGFSKYCMGMALTSPQLPANRFKPRLRRIGKMIRNNRITI